MEISKFNEKLNKIDGNIYVVEEKVELTGGVHDAPLQHDNINTSTLSVYTGPKLTGERIQSYTLSTPSLTPWKRIIRIYADVPVVYISYEAEGDTVEAEDVNLLQDEIVRTQEAVNEEITRAGEAEQNIAADLEEEVTRAQMAEQTVAGNLSAEISRANGAEQELSWSLIAEINRAKAAEKENADNLVMESTRAKSAENTLTENLSEEKTRAMAAEESIKSTIQSNKPNWDDKYTRNEVDNKFSALENAIDWKESVDTYADIAEVYANPQDGWTVNVKDTDYTYRYSGTEWIVISANAIPKATQNVDGLLSKEDKTLYDDANSKKHTHGNKTTIDKITETLLARWSEAYDKRHDHENKGILDTITQALLDNWNAAFAHISDAVKHITATERTNWNDANSKKHTHSNKAILDGITQTLIDCWNAAEVNVQPDWNVTDTTSDTFIKNKPTSLPANGGTASALSNAVTVSDYDTFVPTIGVAGRVTLVKAAANAKSPWNNTTSGFLIESNSGDSAHLFIFRSGDGSVGNRIAHRVYYVNHWNNWELITNFDGKYSSLTDKPTKISTFENDSGYITAADIDTSQNHTHANKGVLDKITQTLVDHWNAAEANIQADWSTTDTTSGSFIKNKPSKVSEFINDSGYMTSNHTHSNITPVDITNTSVDLNNYNLSNNTTCKTYWYVCKTVVGAANITNTAIANTAFLLRAEAIQFSTATDYISKQTFISAKATYERYCTNGTWTPWLPVSTFFSAPVSGQVLVSDGTDGGIKTSGFTIAKSVPADAKFTDTIYTHPTSGIAAGTYKSVTVNTQGHVTAGTNPTTLAGYGITDAAAKTHNHDGTYIKRAGLTWDDLKGV